MGSEALSSTVTKSDGDRLERRCVVTRSGIIWMLGFAAVVVALMVLLVRGVTRV
jgi:hypothetical protein